MKKSNTLKLKVSWLAAILVVPLSIGTLSFALSTSSHADAPRVVGGIDVSVEQASGIVALLRSSSVASGVSNRRSQFCAGTVIDARWILTAAHCVVDMISDDILVLMESAHLDLTPYSPVNITQIIVHEDYINVGAGDDIALLRLAVDAQAAPVPLNTNPVVQGELSFIAGWGRLFAGGFSPTRLQGAFVETTPGAACGTVFPEFANETSGQTDARNICASVPGGGVDTCQGDSGGPLYTITEYSLPIKAVAGITSWGRGCAMAGSPGVYTNVASYIDWIRTNSGVIAEKPPVGQEPVNVDGGVHIAGAGSWDVQDAETGNSVYSGVQGFVSLSVGSYRFTNRQTGFTLDNVSVRVDKPRGIILGGVGWWQVQDAYDYSEFYQGRATYLGLPPGEYHVQNLSSGYRVDFADVQ